MWRWLVLLFVLLFIFGQMVRMQPSRRDKQLQILRQAAAQAGLAVRFWVLRNSGYRWRQLPESGFMYYFPWSMTERPKNIWALWRGADGDIQRVAGESPDMAKQWLDSFGKKIPDCWALLECSATGVGLLWQERGEADDVRNIAQALDLLRKNIDVIRT